MINPQDIDINSLPWLPLESKNAFPNQPAIYFAIDLIGGIQYIGRSQNPKTRWGNHHKFNSLNDIGSIRIAYLFMDADLLPSVESALINWFDPPLNSKTGGSFIQTPTVCDFRDNEVKRNLFKELEFYPFLEYALGGGKWDKNNSMVHLISTKIKAHAKDVKSVFGFYPRKTMADCAVIGMLLNRLGLRSQSNQTRQSRAWVKGSQVYVYQLSKDQLGNVAKILTDYNNQVNCDEKIKNS